MSTNCTVAKRRQAHRAACAVQVCPGVIEADALDPDEGLADGWSVEVTLGAETGGLPPVPARQLASRGLTVRVVKRQAPGWTAIAVL